MQQTEYDRTKLLQYNIEHTVGNWNYTGQKWTTSPLSLYWLHKQLEGEGEKPRILTSLNKEKKYSIELIGVNEIRRAIIRKKMYRIRNSNCVPATTNSAHIWGNL